MSVGRNDPCPCGSGKKYKKCCMSNVVSLENVIGNELDQLQQQLFFSSEARSEIGIDNKIEELIGDSAVEKEEEEILSVVLLFWIIFQESFESIANQTLVEEFVHENKQKGNVRPSTLKQLEKWIGTSPSLSIVTSIEDDNWLEVEDFFTREPKRVKMREMDQELEIGSMLLGFLLPYGSYYTYFFFFLDLTADEADNAGMLLSDAFTQSEHDDPVDFMIQEFHNIVKFLILAEDSLGLLELEWDNPIYEMVSMLYEKKVDELADYYPGLKETGSLLWNTYCEMEQPTIRKPQVHAAALHYFIDSNIPGLGYYTQKELAEIYGVTPASVSKAYRQIEEVLGEEIEELMDEMLEDGPFDDEIDGSFPFDRMGMERMMREATKAIEGQDFDSLNEMNAYLDNMVNNPNEQPKRSLSTQDQAQELIYDAYETDSGAKRVKLAKRALDLDAHCVDAYNILGEEDSNPLKALQHFKNGMELGEKALGASFFKENKGMFWGLIETRPYMRAKANYAQTLSIVGKKKEAIQQYEELLDLNENDNQGIRDLLFQLQVELGEYQKAKELLDRYPDDFTARGTFNSVLMEYLLNGFSEKLKALFRHAQQRNPHVVDYLVKRKRLPRQIPFSFTLGDTREAEIYVADTQHLWEKQEKLLRWLQGMR
ncbi:SEC-C metal-binding domain-containing protein [Terrihalobacillus insolitus]|uniref:SEC-C metal-binding domain-containing protein n=1 Tax=Terrihalobacillus insolitus TaxID=2950438 RepID=UPI00233FCC69|nr:SEC-C metal-binding domain-containing protein [Terrihalobacillus insolitus]MDC3414526.1 SEC-C metal-binding domain-containing protein [Terrihalobacillus insolitus]